MKIVLFFALSLSINFLAFALEDDSKILLDCVGDFDHSTTIRVQIVMDDNGQAILSESFQSGEATTRNIGAEELQSCVFKISPIYDIDRKITKVEVDWKLAYGCGESREIQCVASPNFCPNMDSSLIDP